MVKISKKNITVKEEIISKKTVKKEGSGSNSRSYLEGTTFGVIVLIITIFNIPDSLIIRQLELNKSLFFFISLINAFVIFYGLYYKNEGKANKVINYSFLILLIFNVVSSFFQYFNEFVTTDNFYSKLLIYQQFLIVFTSSAGILAIYLNRENLNKYIDSLFPFNQSQNSLEKVKTKSIGNQISEPIVRLFSQKELLSTSMLFILIVFSAITLFYKLDYFDLYSDESEVTQGAAGYYHTGEFKYWSFPQDKILDQKENRAESHQFLVAQSYKIFGITPWSSRFPSAILGIIFIISGYFISRFFVKDKISAILIVFSFILFSEYLLLFRWARMYALLIPAYLVSAYLGYKFIVEKNQLNFKLLQKPFFVNYLNLNFIYLPFLLIILYFNLRVHQNSTIILPILLIYSIIAFIIVKEKKYLIILSLGILLLIIQFISPWEVALDWFTFFKMPNAIYYNQFLLGYPFSIYTNIVLFTIGIGLLVLTKNNQFRKKFLFLILTGFTSWVLFSFVIDYPVSFRYVSHITPFIIICLIGIYVAITKILYNRVIQIILIGLLFISILIQFNSKFDRIYNKNSESPAKPSIAWQSIIKNYKKGEIIYRHWGPAFYFDAIDTSAVFLKIGGDKSRPFAEIYDTLKRHESGWLTWYSENSWRMDSALRDYSSHYFKKYNGYGVDNNGVEVFYYNKNMLKDTIQFKQDRMLPSANLNVENTYSIAFWLNVKENNISKPLLFMQDSTEVLGIQLNRKDKKSIICKYYSSNDSTSVNYLADGNWHHVVWYQQGGKKNQEFGLIIDGQSEASKKFSSDVNGLIKFSINKYFDGNMDDIRIYNFVLSKKQINTIMQNRGVLNSEKLKTDKVEFETLFHWQKKG